MKTYPKLLSLIAGLLLVAAPVLRADDTPAPAAPTPPASGDQPKHERRGPGDMMERAAKDLNLTADQQAKWKAIGEEEHTAMKALRDDTSVAKEDKRAKGMEINKTYGDQRRAILTPDQQAKFDEMRAKMRERGPRGPKPADKPDTN
jgi:Spy/CpxP family protein refolding chaperone